LTAGYQGPGSLATNKFFTIYWLETSLWADCADLACGPRTRRQQLKKKSGPENSWKKQKF
jgi:hypothetical protein